MTEASRTAAAISSMVRAARTSGAFSAAAWAYGDEHGTSGIDAIGRLSPDRPGPDASTASLFDLASLTKVVALWPIVGTLRAAGRLGLHQPIAGLLPDVVDSPIGRVTAFQLLTHTAGLPRESVLDGYGDDPALIRAGVLADAPESTPGSVVQYGDRAAFVLGLVVEAAGGAPLDRLASDLVWRPLDLRRTVYGPIDPTDAGEVAATTPGGVAGVPRGVVHDPSARHYGEPSGIAGVFSSAEDLARFLEALSRARDGGSAVFPAEWIADSFAVRTGPLRPARGLGWHPSPPDAPASTVWSHNGFTGTALWFEPSSGRWATLLTNRVLLGTPLGVIGAIRERFRCAIFGR